MYLISFPNVTQALKCEALYKKQPEARRGKIVSLPAELEAGCGFAYILEATDEQAIRDTLAEGNVTFERIFPWHE